MIKFNDENGRLADQPRKTIAFDGCTSMKKERTLFRQQVENVVE